MKKFTTRTYMLFSDTDQGISKKVYNGGCIATACLIFAQECQIHAYRVAFYTLDVEKDKRGITLSSCMDLFAERVL